jgi:outer membrane protein assembly factor BamB
MVTEVSRVEAIDCAAGWSVVPVVSDGLVLLTGGAGNAIRDAAGDVPVLQAIDKGGERFRITWPISGREIEPGAVTITPSGDIVFPVYEHDTSLQVLRVSRDGSVVARDELRDGEPYDVVAFDLDSKLRVAVTPLSDQAYLCAWLYRQGRRLGTTYRQWGQPDCRWVGEEWPLYVDNDVVIGTNGTTWVCRDLETGTVLWFTEAAGYQPAGAGGGAFVAIRMNAPGRNGGPVPAGLRSVVLALDPRTGRVLWEAPVDGLIRSAATSPDSVSACAALPDGASCLTVLGNDGEVTATRRLPDAVVIASAPDRTLVLLGQEWLASFDHALEVSWTIAVEPPALSHAARIGDNGLTAVAAAVEGRRAYLRDKGSLRIIEW